MSNAAIDMSPAANHPGSAASTTLDLRWRWLLLAAVFALAWLPFLSAISHGYVDWDDDYNFKRNPMWHGFSEANLDWMFATEHIYMGNYQPLTWMSFAAEYTLWGDNPGRMHLVNILLHALNALLFARLAVRLLAWKSGAPPGQESRAAWIGGAFAALFFALHPLRVESVAWATERRDVLSTFFLLGCVLCWLRTRERGDWGFAWWIPTITLYALSLLSKAWGMTLPALLVLLELWPLRTTAPTIGGVAKSALRTWPFVPLAVWCAWAAMRAQEQVGAAVSWSEHPLANRIAQSAWGSVFYLWKTVLPTGLSPLYWLEAKFDPWRPDYVTAMIVALAITLALIAARKRFPAGLAAWLAFLILASPVLGVFQSGAQKAADRYTYLACLPFAVLAGAGWMLLYERRGARGLRDGVLGATSLGAVVALVVLGACAFRQTGYWKDNESLWRRVIDIDSNNYIAHHNLAATIGEQGREAEAVDLERRSIELSPGLGNVAARAHLATLQMRLGKRDEALTTLIEAFHVDPEHAGVLNALEAELTRRKDREQLYKVFEDVLAKDPRLLLVHVEYGDRLLVDRRSAEAEAQYKAALALEPNFVPALVALARMYVVANRVNEAEPLLTRAMRIQSNNADVFTELGAVRAAQNRMDEALTLFSQALFFDPNHPRANGLLRQYSKP
ncbi:MAG TPA: tetratricopeptide repeat protein [Planctomycetota bacterium]|nr:tetratricopeptide repeat protein [Planctomycetota bacterium]